MLQWDCVRDEHSRFTIRQQNDKASWLFARWQGLIAPAQGALRICCRVCCRLAKTQEVFCWLLQGSAGPGSAGPGEARHGVAGPGAARRGAARQGNIGNYSVHSEAQLGPAGRGKVRHGMAGPGAARRGQAGLGKARHGKGTINDLCITDARHRLLQNRLHIQGRRTRPCRRTANRQPTHA